MIGPGTGLAPFRGFLQERAAQSAKGEAPGEAMLFFGCRHPEQDFIYADELKGWAERGVVRAAHRVLARRRPQGLRAGPHPGAGGGGLEAAGAGAIVYVCGDGSRMEPDVRRALSDIAREHGQDGNAWLDRMIAEKRYVLDVWAGN